MKTIAKFLVGFSSFLCFQHMSNKGENDKKCQDLLYENLVIEAEVIFPMLN